MASIGSWKTTEFERLFCLMKIYIERGITDPQTLVNVSISNMGVNTRGTVTTVAEAKALVTALKLYEKDNRKHVWYEPLTRYTGLKTHPVWTLEEHIQVFTELEKKLRLKNFINETYVAIPDELVVEAQLVLDPVHAKTFALTQLWAFKRAFSYWVINKNAHSWKALLPTPKKGKLGEDKEAIAKWGQEIEAGVLKSLKLVAPFSLEFSKKETPAPSKKKPAAPSKDSSTQTTPALEPSVKVNSPPTHKADRDLPEQIGTALHYLEKALERTFTQQLSNLVSAIRAPQQIAVFPVINQITYKLPKTRGIPMTLTFLPTVRVEVPVKVQTTTPTTAMTPALMRDMVRKLVEEMLGPVTEAKPSSKPPTPTATAKPQETDGKVSATVQETTTTVTPVKSFQELGLALGKQVAPPALETTGRKLSVVILGMRASNLPSVIKGLPTYVTVEAFFELNARAKNRVKHVDYIYVMKYGAAESLDFLKKNSIKHFSNMGESGGGMIRSGILELIDRRGWSDECTVDKIGARS